MMTCRAFLLSFVLLASSASANTFTTDMTDLWWNANESGWGVTATHQGEVIFLTFFIYATDGRAQWYTAQVSYTSQNAQGALVFTGPMYGVTGPWFGTSFNPNAVSVRQVGNATFSAFVDSATLTYSVDGTIVTKALTRQTFRSNNPNASYVGVIKQTASGCSNSANNGTAYGAYGITVSSTSTTFRMVSDNNSYSCTYTGTYSQAGRMGKSQGTFVCPAVGASGSYSFFEIEANGSGITARFTASDNVCSQYTGTFGGGRF